VREVVWAVDTPETLETIAAELVTDRDVRSGGDGTIHSADALGAAIAFRVSRHIPTALDLPETNTVGTNPRRNRPAEGAARRIARPSRFGHVVYWAPGDIEAAAAFYIDRLGFRITDRVGNGGIFLRCAGTTDHHNVLLQQQGDYLGFQHVAYEFRDFDEVMLLGAHMEAQGWRTNVGPLRHNIGSSLSWYIWNPAGGLAEAYCDMDSADDDWQVRTFDPGDPSFYGHAWNARPEQAGRRPADLHDD
jgi:catechol 2,3-dioxygenase-like lactoylglutathione lyase family enzyme